MALPTSAPRWRNSLTMFLSEAEVLAMRQQSFTKDLAKLVLASFSSRVVIVSAGLVERVAESQPARIITPLTHKWCSTLGDRQHLDCDRSRRHHGMGSIYALMEAADRTSLFVKCCCAAGGLMFVKTSCIALEC